MVKFCISFSASSKNSILHIIRYLHPPLPKFCFTDAQNVSSLNHMKRSLYSVIVAERLFASTKKVIFTFNLHCLVYSSGDRIIAEGWLFFKTISSFSERSLSNIFAACPLLNCEIGTRLVKIRCNCHNRHLHCLISLILYAGTSQEST